jgi:probable F420-dependent oxidoreductase
VEAGGVRLALNVFGLPLPSYATLAAAAERSGYDSLWLSDHLVAPVAWEPTYPYDSSGRPGGYGVRTPLTDVWATLGLLAGATTRIRLATGVYILPLRNPFVTAKAAATVQALSGGRLLLGVGAGWMREEFAAVGEDFDSRGARMDEIVAILRLLWSGEPVSHRGEHYAFDTVQMTPAADPAPPIIVGGLTAPALRRAARIGDGWFGPAASLAEVVRARDSIEAERRRLGRDHLPFQCWVRVADPWSPAELASFAEAGFEDLVVHPGQLLSKGARGEGAMLEGIEKLAAATS